MLHDHCITAEVPAPRTIVDLGCGTGVVLDELAVKFPSATDIIGIDITPLESSSSRDSRISFIQGNMHNLMATGPRLAAGTADFVFSRLLIYAITDWPAYIREIFTLLKSGGRAELQDFCDQMFLSDGPALDLDRPSRWEWLHLYREGARNKGLDLDCATKFARWMRECGFVDVKATEYTMPYYFDADRPEMDAMAELQIDDPDGMFWHAFPKVVDGLGLGVERVNELRAQMVHSLGEEAGKYQTYWIVTGMKPGN